jgi:Mrp family chromosome partitioning ATPase
MGRIERALEHANRKPTKEREQSGDNSTRLTINKEEAGVDDPGIDIGKLTKIELDPKKLFQQHRVIMNAQDSIASSAYKILRTRVLQRMRSNGWQTLAVTGTCPNEGKTLTAINLALSMARDVNTTTVLADLDLRRPTIHKYLNYKPRYGVLDCLNDRATIETAMVCPGLERLGLLLNSEPLESSSEMLASPKMSQMLTALKAGADRIVIFDMPPLSASDDVLTFGPLVDAVLIVTAEGISQHQTLSQARELSRDMNIIGTVLNRSSDTTSSYYYYA